MEVVRNFVVSYYFFWSFSKAHHFKATDLNIFVIYIIVFVAQPCQWGSWNEGSCDKSCGGGVRRDTRNKLVQEQNGGYCPDEAYRTQDCNQQQCPTCKRQQGYCVTSWGKDQNSGVKKLDSLDGNNKNRQEQCLKKCRSVAGVTGCELIWDTANRMEDRLFGILGGLFGGGRKRGCYAHTHGVARGNGAGNHFCWPCSDL